MSPELDQALVIGAIGAAIGFFAVRFARRWSKKGSSCSGGDCCAPGKGKAKLKKP